MKDLRGISTVVTGGASGLGAATAAALAEAGAKVALFDLDETGGREHADAVGGIFVPVNMADEAQVIAGFDAAEAAHGPARILVNCAGVAPLAKIVDRDGAPHPASAFRHAIDVNLIGSLVALSHFAARAARLDLQEDERGVIINTASVAAFEGGNGMTAYSASKAGVVGMTLPVARDLAGHAIRVMTIAPGVFWTPMFEKLSPGAQEASLHQIPFPPRAGTPEEFADLVLSIITNPMLNGEVIRLDGGLRVPAR